MYSDPEKNVSMILYTPIVRKLKPVTVQYAALKIAADRCGRYILKIKDID